MLNHPSQRIARVDPSFRWYIGASLLVAIAGGFALALLLPIAEAAGWRWGARWPALVQAHGHLQVAGWVGLFVLGMGFRLVPRFAGTPLRFARLTPVALALLLFGLVGRAAAQPWLDVPGMHSLLILAAAAELAAAVLVALVFGGTLIPVVGTFPVAPLFLLGALGLLAQSVLGCLWLPMLTAEIPIIPPDRDGILLGLQFYSFLLPIVVGVSLRAVPVFFKRRMPRPFEVRLIAALLTLGSLLHAAPILGGNEGMTAQQIGALLIAAAMVATCFETGIWRHPDGLRASARHVALLLRTAYIWMLLAALLLGFGAAQSLSTSRPPAAYAADATRHMLALGLFSTLIAGMAQLVIPLLAQRRLRPRRAKTETWVLWSLFSAAAVLRTVGALIEGAGAGSGRYRVIAVSGLLGIAGVIFLGTGMLRAARAGAPGIALQQVIRP